MKINLEMSETSHIFVAQLPDGDDILMKTAIKQEELMLGNFVQDKFGYPYCLDVGTIFSDSWYGLVLNEWWLITLGFEKFGEYNIYSKDGFQIDKTAEEQEENGYWFFVDQDRDDSLAINVIYVHTLQNAYMALKGKRLMPVEDVGK